MKKPVIILLYNGDHSINEVIEALIETEPKWLYISNQSVDPRILRDESREILVTSTPITLEAVELQIFCERNEIPVFGINIIPTVKRNPIRRAQGDNPFDTRFVNFNSSTTASMISINALGYFNPDTSPCAV